MQTTVNIDFFKEKNGFYFLAFEFVFFMSKNYLVEQF